MFGSIAPGTSFINIVSAPVPIAYRDETGLECFSQPPGGLLLGCTSVTKVTF
jgi:hypothetical protein